MGEKENENICKIGSDFTADGDEGLVHCGVGAAMVEIANMVMSPMVAKVKREEETIFAGEQRNSERVQ